MVYRDYTSRIGGLNHWLFVQEEFKYLISRSFRGENYTNVINGSGVVKGEQKYPKGYQDIIIPELKRRSDFLREIPALHTCSP